MANTGLCYVLIILLTVGLMVWGFLDVLKKRQSTESSDTQTISRQIRGFGTLVLSSVVLIVGIAICAGMSGGIEPMLEQVGSLF